MLFTNYLQRSMPIMKVQACSVQIILFTEEPSRSKLILRAPSPLHSSIIQRNIYLVEENISRVFLFTLFSFGFGYFLQSSKPVRNIVNCFETKSLLSFKRKIEWENDYHMKIGKKFHSLAPEY